jgi:hypothetical protein
MNQKIIFLLLVLIIIIILIIYKLSCKNEQYRYRRQYASLSLYDKAVKLAAKIKRVYDVYENIKNNIPKVKNMLESLTDWNKLKDKLCQWASQQKLIPGLISIITKALQNQKIQNNPVIVTRLNILKTNLYKLESLIAVVKEASSIIKILPNPPISDDIKNKINTFTNIDDDLIQLLKNIPDFGSC